MAGLSLRTGIQASGSAGTGSYTPMTPRPASISSTDNGTIGQQAYGISGTGASKWNDSTAAAGSVGLGVAALIGMIYLWWSLPR